MFSGCRNSRGIPPPCAASCPTVCRLLEEAVLHTAFHRHRGQIQLASGLDSLAGIWLAFSSFALHATADVVPNNIVLGVVVAVLAAVRLLGSFVESLPTRPTADLAS